MKNDPIILIFDFYYVVKTENHYNFKDIVVYNIIPKLWDYLINLQ